MADHENYADGITAVGIIFVIFILCVNPWLMFLVICGGCYYLGKKRGRKK